MFTDNWKYYFNKRKNIIEFTLTLICLVTILFGLSSFLIEIENRAGVILEDPILNLFNPIDMTWLIFGILYFGLIIAVINLINYPEFIICAIQSYIVMICIRIIVMYLLPLNPPETMILLKDPLVEFFTVSKPFTKDLFFSGHTATMFLLFLFVKGRFYKSVFFIGTVILGLSVLLQHVHYSIDVVTAPVFTHLAYRIVKVLGIKSSKN